MIDGEWANHTRHRVGHSNSVHPEKKEMSFGRVWKIFAFPLSTTFFFIYMPEASSSSRAAPQQQQPQDGNQGFLAKYGGQILQMFMIWMAMRLVSQGKGKKSQMYHSLSSNPSLVLALVPNQQSNSNIPPAPLGTDSPQALTMRDFASHIPSSVFYYPQPEIPLDHLATNFAPLWPVDTRMDLTLYTSEAEYFTEFDQTPSWRTEGLLYGGSDRREHHVDLPTTNVSPCLFGHTFCITLDE